MLVIHWDQSADPFSMIEKMLKKVEIRVGADCIVQQVNYDE